MKALPYLLAVGIVLSGVGDAQRCPDPNSRQATIGGDTIDAYVSRQHRPLKSAQVRLLFRDKTIWAGSTGDLGGFRVKGLRPGSYRLAVAGWGIAIIRVSPDLAKSSGNGQELHYSLLLSDNECIATIMVIN